MKQENTTNRIFLIPEDSYDERTENLVSMYSMLKMIIHMARLTGELAMNNKGVKRNFKWMLKRCDKFDAFSDLIIKESNIPASYVENLDRAELESKKAKEIFVHQVHDLSDPDDDFEDEDDDYGDVYDAGFCYDDEDDDGLSCMELEQITDEIYELKEEAANCVIHTADVLQSADELLEAIEEIKYHLNS